MSGTVRLNFIEGSLTSGGQLRRLFARQMSTLALSISMCALAGFSISAVTNAHARRGTVVAADMAGFDYLSQEKELAEVEAVVTARRQAVASRATPSRVIRALCESVPTRSWIRSVDIESDRINLVGSAPEEEDVRTFVASLENHEIVDRVVVESSELEANHGETNVSFHLRARAVGVVAQTGR